MPMSVTSGSCYQKYTDITMGSNLNCVRRPWLSSPSTSEVLRRSAHKKRDKSIQTETPPSKIKPWLNFAIEFVEKEQKENSVLIQNLGNVIEGMTNKFFNKSTKQKDGKNVLKFSRSLRTFDEKLLENAPKDERPFIKHFLATKNEPFTPVPINIFEDYRPMQPPVFQLMPIHRWSQQSLRQELQQKLVQLMRRRREHESMEQHAMQQKPLKQQPMLQNPKQKQPTKQPSMHQRSIQQRPKHQQPKHQQPMHQQPMNQQPMHQQPMHQQPMHQRPKQQQPMQQQSVYQQPILQPSTHQRPMYQRPILQQPMQLQSMYQWPMQQPPMQLQYMHQRPMQLQSVHHIPMQQQPMQQQPMSMSINIPQQLPQFNQNYHFNQLSTITIGPNGTSILRSVYDDINWTSVSVATRKLLTAIFGYKVLGTHSLTGKPSPAFRGRERPAKNQLDPLIIADIIYAVTARCGVTERKVRQVITTKCADSTKMLKQKRKKFGYFGF